MTRRHWFALHAAAVAGLAASRKPRVACVMNVYSPNSHADVFLSRLMDGYRLEGAWHPPRTEPVAFYVDQFPPNDMARELAAEHGIRICGSIAEAVDGVDAVAVIGEHGDYPRTPLGNFAYPRKRYFDQIANAFERSGKVLPLFSDKYLAYEWRDARAIFDRVRAMRIPFLCGSTVPLTEQRPLLKLPRGADLEQALSVSYSDLEEHAYHGIEAMQSVVERRKGGETGVEAVRYVEGDEAWKLAPDLRDAALSRRVNATPAGDARTPVAFQVKYRDGLEGIALHLPSSTSDFLFAARVRGSREVQSTCFYIGLYTHFHWGYLVRAFEDLALTGKAAMPPERTLLSNGILLAGLQSRRRGGEWIRTPELEFSYSWPR